MMTGEHAVERNGRLKVAMFSRFPREGREKAVGNGT